jgi:hypothetical protein
MNRQNRYLFETPLPTQQNRLCGANQIPANRNPLCQPTRKITHGGDDHRARIARIVARMCAQGWCDIRVDRKQVVELVIVAGQSVRKVRNRPDISGINPKTGQRVHIEIDLRRDRSKAHERKIVQNDPNAVSTYVIIKPTSRSKRMSQRAATTVEGRTYKPGKGTTIPRNKP